MTMGSITMLLAYALSTLPLLQNALKVEGCGNDLWEYIKNIDEHYQVAHVPSEAKKNVVQQFANFGFQDKGLLDAKGDCILGLAAMAQIAIDKFEVKYGLEVARKYAIFLRSMIEEMQEHNINATEFGWNIRTHQSESFPMILGLLPQQKLRYGKENKQITMHFPETPHPRTNHIGNTKENQHGNTPSDENVVKQVIMTIESETENEVAKKRINFDVNINSTEDSWNWQGRVEGEKTVVDPVNIPNVIKNVVENLDETNAAIQAEWRGKISADDVAEAGSNERVTHHQGPAIDSEEFFSGDEDLMQKAVEVSRKIQIAKDDGLLNNILTDEGYAAEKRLYDRKDGNGKPLIGSTDGVKKWVSTGVSLPQLLQEGERTASFDATEIGIKLLRATTTKSLASEQHFLEKEPLVRLVDVKVYVFDFADDLWTQRPLLCSQGMFATESLFHRWLMHSPYRVYDPEEADFFYMPMYPSCIQTKFDRHFDDLNFWYIDKLRNPKSLAKYYFERNDGRDFIFLWSSECIDFPRWRTHLQRSVFLAVERVHIECTKEFGYVNEENAADYGKSCYHCNNCYSPWKDIMIPGFVEKWSTDLMTDHAVSFKDRELLACYHGADSEEISLYKYANATARNEIQERLQHLPGTSIGRRIGVITEYFKRIGQCVFCFVPKGLGYWSNRMYEVMYLGCIPVILSDEVGFPFPERIPWKDFTIKWPMNYIDVELVQYLEDLMIEEPEVVEQMHRAMMTHLCWINWHSQSPKCSPYRAIIDQLYVKKVGFPRYAGRYWNKEKDIRKYEDHMPFPYYRDQMEGGLPEVGD